MKITPFLWFDNQAEEAINFYISLFPNSQITHVARYPEGTPAPAGSFMTGGFTLDGQSFAAINGGPQFKINPSISFYTVCETEEEINTLWAQLVEGGFAMMALDKYPWSERYGWLKDRFGMTWQLTLGKVADIGRKITPSMLFTEGVHGRGNEAIQFYTSIFKDSSVGVIVPYQGHENDYVAQGMVMYSQFYLSQQSFIIMDAGMPQPYTFNEALSYLINCDTQEEVDFYWNQLIADGGSENQCGWLKDKFGVSWQVIPKGMYTFIGGTDSKKSKAAIQAMFKMRKIDLAVLQKAYDEA